MMGPARRPLMSGNMGLQMGGFQLGTSLNMGGSMFMPFSNGFGSRTSTSTNPYGMNPSAMGSSMSPYMMSPSMMSGNSYMNANAYSQGSSPSGSGSSDASAAYAGQGYRSTGYGQGGTDQTTAIAPAILFGLPAENGHVEWPLGLRILAPANETKALRAQLELVLSFVAAQAAAGQVNLVLTHEGLQAVRDLRQLLKPREGTMADATYTDALRFLNRAERALTTVKRMETTHGGA